MLHRSKRSLNWRTLLHIIATFIFIAASHEKSISAENSGDKSTNSRVPNIVLILADDLGYGDVQCLNPTRGKIPTPNLDRLAAEGVAFTDAHSSSAVCTPTRYGILTGRYNWRTTLQNGVLYGESPPLIPPERLTVGALLKQHGYRTACIGKWHLGLDMNEKDWSQSLTNGPITRGFDTYFGISASLDMPPFAFIEQDHFTQLPTATKKWIRQGPAAPDFEAVDVLPTFTRKAVEFITAQSAQQPFFLYLPLASPHTPIVPTKDWQDKSKLGAYGDFVMQTDAAVGEVLAALEKSGLADNTLVIMTSDNGCSPAANTGQLEKQGHFASADRRGYKADAWDGGHHVPFLARWPAVAKAGTRCEQMVCLNDFMATCAEILGAKLPDNAGEDSVSILPLLRGSETPTREWLVHHSIGGKFAIREGKWKLDLCPGSGGWASPKDAEATKKGLPEVQLYDMATDLGEQKNLEASQPERVARMTAMLEKFVADGRSTPGEKQANDAKRIDIFKKEKAK